MWFKSDNAGPAAPEIIDAVTRANSGYATAYGSDEIMDRVRDRVREIFEAPDVAVYLVATGTAANALSLAALVQPWNAIYCSDHAHVEWDECGAPEFFTGGAKLVKVAGPNGLVDPDALAAKLADGTNSDVHQVQRGALSLTNAGELGGVYSASEVATLTSIAGAHALPVHMDGARFANALIATGATPAEMTWKAGVDVLSFGGTKNGLLGVEAVILFDPARAREFELRRKRGGHLFSKHRFLSAQMDAYLTDGLWLDLAARANAANAKLATGLAALGVDLLYAQDANLTFAQMPRRQHVAAMANGAQYYLWPHTGTLDGDKDDMVGCRMVCNWATTDADVDGLLAVVKAAANA